MTICTVNMFLKCESIEKVFLHFGWQSGKSPVERLKAKEHLKFKHFLSSISGK